LTDRWSSFAVKFLLPLISKLPLSSASIDIQSLTSHNAALGHPLFSALLKASADPTLYLVALAALPPSLPSYDLLGRLLQDPSPILAPRSSAHTTVAELVRTEVLGQFTHEAIEWLERADREEQEGIVSDDRFAKGVKNVCVPFSSHRVLLNADIHRSFLVV
jgi:hypothetical protein